MTARRERGLTTAVARPQLPVSLDEVSALSPLLLAGRGAVELAHELVRRLLAQGTPVIVADGANAFDAYALVRQAPRHMAPAWLANARVSRAFTWQQQLALLEREVSAEAARQRTRWAVALGPLDLLADSDVKPHEAQAAAERTARALARLSAEQNLSVIAAQEERPLNDSGRTALLERLKGVCRAVVTVERLPGASASGIPARR